MKSYDSPALLLDASTPWMHAGVIDDGKWLSLERSEGDSLTTLPELVKTALGKSGKKLPGIRTFIHCEGPGALLGLRLASMMIEAWRASTNANTTLLGYRSLEMAAAIIALDTKNAGYRVATPFRKGSYSVFTPDCAGNEVLDEDSFNALAGTCYLIPQRHIKSNPPAATPFVYDLTRLPDALSTKPEILHATDKATAFAPQYAEYKLWDGKRHKAQ